MTCSSDHLSLSSRHRHRETSWTGWSSHLDSLFVSSSHPVVCVSSGSTVHPFLRSYLIPRDDHPTSDRLISVRCSNSHRETQADLCSTIMIFNHLFLDNLLWTQWMSFSASVSLFGLLVIYSNLIPEPIKRIFKYGKAAERHVIGMKKLRKIELPKRYVYSDACISHSLFPMTGWREEKKTGTIDPCFTLFLIDLNLLKMRWCESERSLLSVTCYYYLVSSSSPSSQDDVRNHPWNTSSSCLAFAFYSFLSSSPSPSHRFQTLYFWPRNHEKRECDVMWCGSIEELPVHSTPFH